MNSLKRVGLEENGRIFRTSSPAASSSESPSRGLSQEIRPLILADEPTGALDSRTGREVLDFLKKLNEEGNTIVMITHDSSIALEAKRVVRIHDGKINFDGDVKSMLQSFKMALKSIWGNKLRSFLTMLGIIIGVASVIILVSIVNGYMSYMVESFSSMGVNQITVQYKAVASKNHRCGRIL